MLHLRIGEAVRQCCEKPLSVDHPDMGTQQESAAGDQPDPTTTAD